MAFIYQSAKIENDQITYHNTREIFDHGGVTGYTGDVRSLFEIQNSVAAYYRMLDAFEKREPLSEMLICELQELLTQGTYDTPIRYLKQVRIQKAAELLTATDWKISDIGAECGFQEMSYFAKTFRELKGCTPGMFRKYSRQFTGDH